MDLLFVIETLFKVACVTDVLLGVETLLVGLLCIVNKSLDAVPFIMNMRSVFLDAVSGRRFFS
jgi:hypothetical protein